MASGGPQGSVLRLVLFLLYINDLLESVKSQCRLFAGDALLYNEVKNRIIVQDDLNRLQCWADNLEMVSNLKKCCHFTLRKNVNSRNTFYPCGEKLKVVKSNSYLEIEFQHDLKWDSNINNINAKARQLLGMTLRVLRDADENTRKIAYTTLVRPSLEYGCMAWDQFLKKKQGYASAYTKSSAPFHIQHKGANKFYRIKSRKRFRVAH